ncbi:conserved hypothetical protein [Methanosalsum zhilinae DSM 4017]|uniref:Uncharacterized protein n=1 Tax=Methanosalsum zhilinae (strain DSM 4017 / NBRC 107636 / OCM 62 / WeN5) TaxID=679901 RepID=F7XLY8_METZD|nr:hypothetical protein [Methanosalsum zhilinae]AEH60916.1 conserved hypothetical protein [Methanosalsum zhilinae DSM 4017]
MSKTDESIFEWTEKVPLSDSIVLKQLFLIILIAVTFTFIVVLVIERGAFGELLLIFSGILIFLFLFLLFVVYFLNFILKGGFETEFRIGGKGISTQSGTASKRVNNMTILGGIFGFLSGSKSAGATATGAGLISKTRESEMIRWSEIRKISVYSNKKMIMVHRKSFFGPILVVCTEHNFSDVLQYIKSKQQYEIYYN